MKREVKIGIFAVAMIGCAWGGIRFLSGVDIFSRNTEYYAAYDMINGVQSASPIFIKGVKVGTVTDISFDPQKNNNVVLRLTIKKQYRIPENSEARIISNGLMGAKAIDLTLGSSTTFLHEGDTLLSSRDRDIMDMAGSELEFFKHKLVQLVGDISTTLGNINGLVVDNAQNINGAISHINSISGNLDNILISERDDIRKAINGLSEFSATLGNNSARIDSIFTNVDNFTSKLSRAEIIDNLSKTLSELNTMLSGVNGGNGTVGKLFNDPKLYDDLTLATRNLASLLADVEAYPKRYVHFSVFGGGQKKADRQREKDMAAQADTLSVQ